MLAGEITSTKRFHPRAGIALRDALPFPEEALISFWFPGCSRGHSRIGGL